MAREIILAEHEKAHGDFRLTAATAQELKQAIGKYDVKGIPYTQREALEMIATKIARILIGDHMEEDHWKDIAGYANLGLEECHRNRGL